MSNPAAATDPAIDQQRSQAYGFFAAAMEYPEGELTELIRTGNIARRAREVFCAIYPELESKINWDDLAKAGEDDELSIEYTRLFDVGGSDGPPCALNSGAAKGDTRMGLLEELVRFYNYFGLTAAGTEANELPDHLSVQFEFMYFLIEQELEHRAASEPADDFIRAQRDFINRHPYSWVSVLNGNLQSHKAPAYYLALGELMERYIELERRALELKVAHLPPPEPHPEMPGENDTPGSALAQGMKGATSSVITIHKKNG